jgi:hypothetical protein
MTPPPFIRSQYERKDEDETYTFFEGRGACPACGEFTRFRDLPSGVRIIEEGCGLNHPKEMFKFNE